MVEIECPSCTETVDLGSDSTGTYECPYCSEDFQYEVGTSTRDSRLIDEIEYGDLKPDYILQERRYLSTVASKIIPTMVAICFIPLLGIGLIMLWFIWSHGPISKHDYMTVFLKKQNLVLDYYLLNSEIETSNSFEITEHSVINWRDIGNEEHMNVVYWLDNKSTGERMSLPGYRHEVQEFADFVGIDLSDKSVDSN